MKNQREGWLGEDYVRVYADSDRGRVADLYEFAKYLPGYEPVGSWGLDVLCLGPDSRLYLVDWIPLNEEFKREAYPDLATFEKEVAQIHEADVSYEFFQREIHYTQPIVFGGDPEQEPLMIDQNAHAEICRFWNQKYAEFKRKKAP